MIRFSPTPTIPPTASATWSSGDTILQVPLLLFHQVEAGRHHVGGQGILRAKVQGEVAWQLPTGVLTYWRGRLTEIAYDLEK
jgi:hypothetical protein